MDDEGKQAEIASLREDILGDLIEYEVGAAAVKRHPKTLRRMNPPTVYIGRTPYLPKEPFRAWVMNGCKPLDPAPRGGRGRKAA